VLPHVNSRFKHHRVTTKPWNTGLNIAQNGYVVHSILKWFEVLNKIPTWLGLVKVLQIICNFRGISLYNHPSKWIFLICWQMLNPWQICKIINRTSPFHICISNKYKNNYNPHIIFMNFMAISQFMCLAADFSSQRIMGISCGICGA